MSTVKKPIITDATGQEILAALKLNVDDRIAEVKEAAETAVEQITTEGEKQVAALEATGLDGISKTLAAAILDLYGKNKALAALFGHLGKILCTRVDSERLPYICGEPFYSSGDGAPTEAPKSPFSEYFDRTNIVFYKAKSPLSSTPTVADWIALNN